MKKASNESLAPNKAGTQVPKNGIMTYKSPPPIADAITHPNIGLTDFNSRGKIKITNKTDRNVST
ncbi:hypothetical protein LP316_11120 [Thalassotalea sp. LPB0316]|uniref:hypothetical protein n=1 Tax=Thalassotalea sp. LPB0316 TaxID=2769490 RepID=UPI0018672AD8|nr:hypothetical protein [Thalassotalea sp. LPB0316]QOL24859.1 hypothetical protein LP316_11120 [Thalassotalea sp. LPB0316]